MPKSVSYDLKSRLKIQAVKHFNAEDILFSLSTVQLFWLRHKNKAVYYFMIKFIVGLCKSSIKRYEMWMKAHQERTEWKWEWFKVQEAFYWDFEKQRLAYMCISVFFVTVFAPAEEPVTEKPTQLTELQFTVSRYLNCCLSEFKVQEYIYPSMVFQSKICASHHFFWQFLNSLVYDFMWMHIKSQTYEWILTF